MSDSNSRRFLSELAQGNNALGFFAPNWFASVMGTGIVANAAATLPYRPPGLIGFAQCVWIFDVVLLAAVLVAFGVHWVRSPEVAKSHLDNATLSHFYGAPAMALLTVGAGALLVGSDVVGTSVAVPFDAVLWVTGTALGLFTAVAVPYKAFTSHAVKLDSAFGGWLMPVVPPMVSAALGALLIPHLPAGQWREAMLLCCYALFGLTLMASIVIITLVWGRLVHYKVGAAAAVPTLWIVLGPLGQSITAAGNLGNQAPAVLSAPYGEAFRALGVLYGMPMWGFAILWFVLAGAITIRQIRLGLPFSLTWWSFTFPVGTVVTGTSSLASHTGADFLCVAAAALYVFLLVAWLTVAVRTARGTWTGKLLNPPAPAPVA